eukprot:m.106908 g.106908  ORF g.106908 m.106908 type:complete len:760 (-) comp9165_c0_seq1:29-2308(-)
MLIGGGVRSCLRTGVHHGVYARYSPLAHSCMHSLSTVNKSSPNSYILQSTVVCSLHQMSVSLATATTATATATSSTKSHSRMEKMPLKEAMSVWKDAQHSDIMFTAEDCIANNQYAPALKIFNTYTPSSSLISKFITAASSSNQHLLALKGIELAKDKELPLQLQALKAGATSATYTAHFSLAHSIILDLMERGEVPSQRFMKRWLVEVLEHDKVRNPRAPLKDIVNALDALPYLSFKQHTYMTMLPYSRNASDIKFLYNHAVRAGDVSPKLADACVHELQLRINVFKRENEEKLPELTNQGGMARLGIKEDHADMISPSPKAASTPVTPQQVAHIYMHMVVPIIKSSPSKLSIMSTLPQLASNHLHHDIAMLVDVHNESFGSLDLNTILSTLSHLTTPPKASHHRANLLVHGALGNAFVNSLNTAAAALVSSAYSSIIHQMNKGSTMKIVSEELQKQLMDITAVTLHLALITKSFSLVDVVLQTVCDMNRAAFKSQKQKMVEMCFGTVDKMVVLPPSRTSKLFLNAHATVLANTYNNKNVLSSIVAGVSKTTALTLADFPQIVIFCAVAAQQLPPHEAMASIEALFVSMFSTQPKERTNIVIPLQRIISSIVNGASLLSPRRQVDREDEHIGDKQEASGGTHGMSTIPDYLVLSQRTPSTLFNKQCKADNQPSSENTIVKFRTLFKFASSTKNGLRKHVGGSATAIKQIGVKHYWRSTQGCEGYEGVMKVVDKDGTIVSKETVQFVEELDMPTFGDDL